MSLGVCRCNAYLKYDGCGREFVGVAETLDEAHRWADLKRKSGSEEWK